MQSDAVMTTPLPVRELAHWHLDRLAPAGQKIAYDAAADEAARHKAAEQWRALIPPGQLPPPPKKEEIKNELPSGMQGFVFNTRRPLFQDARVRQALGYAFDFEWTNKNFFFGQYRRSAGRQHQLHPCGGRCFGASAIACRHHRLGRIQRKRCVARFLSFPCSAQFPPDSARTANRRPMSAFP